MQGKPLMEFRLMPYAEGANPNRRRVLQTNLRAVRSGSFSPLPANLQGLDGGELGALLSSSDYPISG